MIGFIIGTFCLVALVRTLSHGGGGWGGGWGHRRGYGGGCGGRFHRGFGHGYAPHGDGWHGDFGGRMDGGMDRGDDRFDPRASRGGWYGDDATGGYGRPPTRRGFGFGRGLFLRSIFSRLRTSPAQERVIRDAIDDVVAVRRQVRDEMKSSRKDVARSMRADAIDETQLGETFTRHDAVIDEMRKAVVAALVKVHAVLDERQRVELADLMEARFGFGGR